MPRGLSRLPLTAIVATVLAGQVLAGQDGRLVAAAKSRDIAAVRTLLTQKADVNARQPDGATALHWAAHWDDTAMAELLIHAGARVDVTNDYSITPLSLACTNGSATMIDILLNAGANPNVAQATGETALMTAARTGHLDAVNALLARHADVNAQEAIEGQTALMWAVSEGHLEVTRALLEHGANVRARSTSGFSPLLFAAREGNLEAVQMLLQRGANVNDTAVDGTGVLLAATMRGHAALAGFLLSHGADPNADAAGYAALHWAAGKWESMLTSVPVSAEWRAAVGVYTGKGELIKSLLDHGATPNIRLRKSPPRFGYSLFGLTGLRLEGATPFLLAAMGADVEALRMLLARGADPLLTTADHTTPLMMAAGIGRVQGESVIPEQDHLEAVQLVLASGADVSAANDAGNTALHAAAMAGYDTVVQVLVDRGAPLNVRNRNGETPLKIAEGFVFAAQVYAHPSTASLLRRLGATQ